MLFWVGSSFVGWGQYNVTTSQTWDPGSHPIPPLIENGIEIDANVTLTIENLNYQFNTSAEITLNPGSKLILENVILSATTNTWQGIRATGNNTIDQYSVEPDPETKNNESAWEGVLFPEQTLVKLENTNVINAFNGIISTQGAVVRVKSSDFINCQNGVRIIKYTASGHPKINASYIINTNFIWDNNNELIDDAIRGIVLLDVSHINIGGCNFENNISLKKCINERGIGIEADGASFSVQNGGNEFCEYDICDKPEVGLNCGTTGCTFKNLSYGIFVRQIDFTRSAQTDNDIFVYNSLFENNLVAYYNSLTRRDVIDNCIFYTRRSEIGDLFHDDGCEPSSNDYFATTTITGLRTRSTNFAILRNEFNSDAKNTVQLELINNYNSQHTTSRNNVKQNHFVNQTSGYDNSDEAIAILISDDNRMLEVTCNTFEDFGTDIEFNNATIDDFTKKGECPQNVFSASNFPVHNNIIGSITGAATYYYTTGFHPAFFVPSFDEFDVNNKVVNCSLNCDDLIASVQRPKTSKEKAFIIYPNPTSDDLQIGLNGAFEHQKFTAANVHIRSVNGATVKNFEINGIEGTILSIKDLTPGLYFVEVMIQGQIIGYQKLIKQ
jgi:hypothetical protein